MARYVPVFSVSAAALIVAAAVGRTIGVSRERRRLTARDLREANRNIPLRFKVFFFSSNIYTLALSVVLPVYLFAQTHNYYLVGVLGGSVLASGSVLGNLLTPWLLFRDRPWVHALYGIAVIATGLLLMDSSLAAVAAFLSGFTANLLTVPISNGTLTAFMGIMDVPASSYPYWISREYYLVGGRVSMLVALLASSILGGASALQRLWHPCSL